MNLKPKIYSFASHSLLFCLAVGACLMVFPGCRRPQVSQFGGDPLEALVDTVYAGESREVLLTDLTGGFYYDDAFRESNLGEYGYSRWERRYLAGWELFDLDGNLLDDQPDICVVRPEWVTRHYLSGLIERVEAPLRRPGLVVTIEYPRRDGFVLRPHFDLRPLDREEAPDYTSAGGEPGQGTLLALSRTDEEGGWLAVAVPSRSGASFLSGTNDQRVIHHRGELTGRPGVSIDHIEGDLQVKGSGPASFAFGWGESSGQAAAAARGILGDAALWRQQRLDWERDLLGRLLFRSENAPFERAFAWGRLTLAGMVVEQGDEAFLIGGIPGEPCSDGWFTMLSLPGIAALEGTPDLALRLMKTVLSRQERDTTSDHYGMFPGRVTPEEAEYRVPMISGLAVEAYQGIENRFTSRDTTFEDSLALALVRDLVGTVNHRLRDGMVVGGDEEHFLWDGPAAPRRAGAAIETQILFGRLRRFLHDYPRTPELAPWLPPSILDWRGRGTEYFVIRGPRERAEQLSEWLKLTRYVAGEGQTYLLPLPTPNVLLLYQQGEGGRCADRLPFTEVEGEQRVNLFEPDTTIRVAHALALGWQYPGDRRRQERLLDRISADGLVGQAGLRSLAPAGESYQSAHEYRFEDAPSGSLYQGDVLVWTAGRLGDMYLITEQWDTLAALAETVAKRVTARGVVGALSEAENAEPQPNQDDITGSPAHSAALAEFVRLVSDGVIGVVPSTGRLLRLRPRMPEAWGNFRIETELFGGRIWLERYAALEWKVGQDGIEPSVRLIVDIVPAPGERAQHSVRAYPGESISLSFYKGGDGIWHTRVKGDAG